MSTGKQTSIATQVIGFYAIHNAINVRSYARDSAPALALREHSRVLRSRIKAKDLPYPDAFEDISRQKLLK